MSEAQGSCWDWQSRGGFEVRKNCQEPDLNPDLNPTCRGTGRKLRRGFGSVGQPWFGAVQQNRNIWYLISPLIQVIPDLAAHGS